MGFLSVAGEGTSLAQILQTISLFQKDPTIYFKLFLFFNTVRVRFGKLC